MSEADKMFQELEYEKEDRRYGIIYTNKLKYIGFNYLSRTVNINSFITMRELEAINKKVEELKWN